MPEPMKSIRVYYGDLTELPPLPEQITNAHPCSPAEISASQQTSLWLRKLLALELCVSAHDLEFTYGENGKPALVEHAISFNLAHTDKVFALAVSHDLPAVGIDIENSARRLRNPAAFAEACLDPDMLQQWLQIATTARSDFLLRHWVQREAAVKASGTGLAMGWSVSIHANEAIVAGTRITCPHYLLGQHYLALAWPASTNKMPAITWRALGTEWPITTL